MTLFSELARASNAMKATRSRLEKTRLISDLLSSLDKDEVAIAVGFLAAEPLCGALGLGPSHLYALSDDSLVPAADAPSLSIKNVHSRLVAVRELAREDFGPWTAALFSKLTEDEREFLIGSLSNTLRQGGLAGVLTQALSKMANVTEADARRAVMLKGSIARAVDTILFDFDRNALSIEFFRPIAPMLASTADSVEEALAEIPDARVEWKVDGVRIQVHKMQDRIAVYSRQGNDITRGCEPCAHVFRNISAQLAVLDGEIALCDEAGVARPFQETFSALSGAGNAASLAQHGQSLRVFLFDCMHRDGLDLLDTPLRERVTHLEALVPADSRMPAIFSSDPIAAKSFYDEALARGHEGVVVKDAASVYRLGARGDAWKKVKRVRTVDLVVLAAEWGSGRRKGFLSNLHLGARKPDGTFAMVGKTFKGLTDEMLAFQTERLLALETKREDHVVYVRPELVVEIAFNDVQVSPRYALALRFARVVRHREDKPASEADTLETLEKWLPNDPKKKKQLSLFE